MEGNDNQNGAQPLDLIWGAENIARVIGRTHRQTSIMLLKGELPAKQVNSRWVARRSALTKFFEETAA